MQQAAPGKGALRRRLIAYVIFPVAMFMLGYSGVFQSMGKGLTLFFKHYTEAELRKLEASGFINESGSAEYVIGLNRDLLELSGEEFLATLEGVIDVRTTSFSNWYVVSVDVGNVDPVNRIRDRSETQFVLQNRGLWICH